MFDTKRAARAAMVALALGAAISGCSKDNPTSSKVTSYAQDYNWTCTPTGTNCQDVFDFDVAAGSVITVTVKNVSSGSISQIAVYGPSVALGGTNLLTGNTTELRCGTVSSCASGTAGETKGFTAATAGRYRVAVTRDWGSSCGGTGDYRLEVTSSVAFTFKGQTVEDVASLASGFSCP